MAATRKIFRLLLFIIAALLCAGCVSREETAKRLIAEVKSYNSQGDYARAVESAGGVVALFEASRDDAGRKMAAQGYFWRGYSNDLWRDKLRGGRRVSPETAQRHDAAIADYEAAIERDAGFVEAYFDLGLIYYDDGEFEKALANFGKVAEISPTTAQARAYIADIYFQQGKYEEASGAIADFLKSGAEGTIEEVKRLSHEGRIDEAIGLLENALARNPDFAEAHKELGLLYLVQKADVARARYHLEIYAGTLPEGAEKEGMEKILDALRNSGKR